MTRSWLQEGRRPGAAPRDRGQIVVVGNALDACTVGQLSRDGLSMRALETPAEIRGPRTLAPVVVVVRVTDSDLGIVSRVRAVTAAPLVAMVEGPPASLVVGALDAGCDDAITPAVPYRELLARLRVRLREAERGHREVLRLGALEVDVDGCLVLVRGQPVSLTPLEFGLMVCLARRAGALVTHGELIGAVWGDRFESDPRVVSTYLARLRAKLDQAGEPGRIGSVPGRGYRLSTGVPRQPVWERPVAADAASRSELANAVRR